MTEELRTPRDEGDQPLPIPNQRRHIHDLVAEDLQARKALGTRRYGTPLQAFNGRDSLVDLYQELLDACVYIRTVIEERDSIEQAA